MPDLPRYFHQTAYADSYAHLHNQIPMKHVIIVGATSGIGREIALIYAQQGWNVGIAGRRETLLKELHQQYPSQICYETIDVTQDEAVTRLQTLIEKNNGMDLFLLSSGVGFQNPSLDPSIELHTAKTNVEGFVRLTTAAFHYFEQQGKGHMAVISSIAGTKGIGVAAAYSATKRFQNCYIDALEQLAGLKKLAITFTDIRPGFVATALLKTRNYPMLMQPQKVARTIVKAIGKKKRVCIIDGRYRLLVALWRLIPRGVWKRLPIK